MKRDPFRHETLGEVVSEGLAGFFLGMTLLIFLIGHPYWGLATFGCAGVCTYFYHRCQKAADRPKSHGDYYPPM